MSNLRQQRWQNGVFDILTESPFSPLGTDTIFNINRTLDRPFLDRTRLRSDLAPSKAVASPEPAMSECEGEVCIADLGWLLRKHAQSQSEGSARRWVKGGKFYELFPETEREAS